MGIGFRREAENRLPVWCNSVIALKAESKEGTYLGTQLVHQAQDNNNKKNGNNDANPKNETACNMCGLETDRGGLETETEKKEKPTSATARRRQYLIASA